MQVKEFNQAKLIDDECESFMNQKLSFYDMQPNFAMTQQASQEKQVSIPAVPIKGKGRPKGQKNCKDRERKTKLVLNEENRRRGHWSIDENKRYHWFLEVYNKHFICKEMRRLDKIFKTMAVFIGSREAEQCRSHHQKMEKKYHSFSSIVLYLRRFHYGTQDSAIVEEDMIRNNITEISKLMGKKELQDLQLIKEASTVHSLLEEQKVDCLVEEPQKQFQFQQNLLDLLGQDYEYRFEFDHCLL